MRITGGIARGIPLKAPPGDKVRPAMDATREAVFSHLGPLVEGALVLDLFAGTGAYALEALSRGAASAQLVEKDPRALAALQQNLASLAKSFGKILKARAISADALTWQPAFDASFDLVFVDPPYALWESHGGAIIKQAKAHLTTGTHARLLLECPGGFDPGELPGLRLIKRLGKGKKQPSVLVYAVARAA